MKPHHAEEGVTLKDLTIQILSEAAEAPSKRCEKCGSRVFYFDPDSQEYFCGKHEPPNEARGQQYFILKSTKQAEIETRETGEPVVTKADISAAVAKVLDSRINLKPFSSQHASVAAVKGMTGSVAEETMPAGDRDMFGLKQKEETKSEYVRDIHGRRRKVQ